jgi:hypothetical protein
MVDLNNQQQQQHHQHSTQPGWTLAAAEPWASAPVDKLLNVGVLPLCQPPPASLQSV